MNYHSKPATYIGEVRLNVTDIERSTKFYKDIIGLNILQETSKMTVFTADGKNPLVTIQQPDSVQEKEQQKTGLYHFALLLPNRTELGKIIKHFIRNRVRLGAADHKVSEALYLSDPDGNGIEIYVDRDPKMWVWHGGLVEMTTDPLDGENVIAASGNEEWSGIPPQTVMGHIHLHVANLPAAQKFYEALGFLVVSHYPKALFMSTAQYHHHIGLNTWNGEGIGNPSENSAGLQAFTLIYPDMPTRQKAVAAIEAMGSTVTMEENTLRTEDPSGNQMILRLA